MATEDLDQQQSPSGNRGATGMADFERHMPRVFDWALRLTRDEHRAMDVVQDVFLKWNRQCAIEVPASPPAWLRTVTARRVFELARSPKLSVVRVDNDAEIPASDGPRPAQGDRDLLRDDVMRALSELSEAQRDVALAKIMDGRTFAEIAQEQDISISTAKTHYLRAVRALRETLSPRWKDEQ